MQQCITNVKKVEPRRSDVFYFTLISVVSLLSIYFNWDQYYDVDVVYKETTKFKLSRWINSYTVCTELDIYFLGIIINKDTRIPATCFNIEINLSTIYIWTLKYISIKSQYINSLKWQLEDTRNMLLTKYIYVKEDILKEVNCGKERWR